MTTRAPAGQASMARGRPVPSRGLALAVLCLSLLIVTLDNTVLNVVLPVLVRDLAATTTQLQWIVDAYVLVFAGLLLVCGSAADRAGRKWTYLAGLAVFAAGSAAAAFSGHTAALIAARAGMGIGGALIMPSTLSIITAMYPDGAARHRAIGIWAGTSGAGVALGPIIGGLLLARFWWGSVFLINLPIAAIALALAVPLVPNSRRADAKRPDIAGAALAVAAGDRGGHGRAGRARPVRARRAARLPSAARPSHAARQVGLGRGFGGRAGHLRPVRRALRADAVPAVLAGLHAAADRGPRPARRGGGRRVRAAVGARGARGRRQADDHGRARAYRGRPVAGLIGHGRDDLPGGAAGDDPARGGRRAGHTVGHQLGDGLGPRRGHRGGGGDQRLVHAARRRAGRGGDRQPADHEVPGRDHGRARAVPRPARGDVGDPRLARRGAGGRGAGRRGRGCAARAGRQGGVRERHGPRAARRRGCRPGWRGHRAGHAARAAARQEAPGRPGPGQQVTRAADSPRADRAPLTALAVTAWPHPARLATSTRNDALTAPPAAMPAFRQEIEPPAAAPHDQPGAARASSTVPAGPVTRRLTRAVAAVPGSLTVTVVTAISPMPSTPLTVTCTASRAAGPADGDAELGTGDGEPDGDGDGDGRDVGTGLGEPAGPVPGGPDGRAGAR